MGLSASQDDSTKKLISMTESSIWNLPTRDVKTVFKARCSSNGGSSKKAIEVSHVKSSFKNRDEQKIADQTNEEEKSYHTLLH